MATEAPNHIPATKDAWRQRVQELGIPGLHQMTALQPASNINEPQFLAFKVIWPERKPATEFSFDGVRADLETACQMLAEDPGFQAYLTHILNGETELKPGENGLDLGAFTIPRDFQLLILHHFKRVANDEGIKLLDDLESRMKQLEFSASNRKCAEDIPGPKKETLFPAMVDIAAGLFFQTIAFVSQKACIFMPFTMPFQNVKVLSGACMQARVLRKLMAENCDDVFAIIRVDSKQRTRKSNPRILWQDSAAIIAWINHEVKNKRVYDFPMRLLIAQNHDEVYLCVPKYDDGYLKFLTEDDDSTGSFLEIQEYGPFFIDERDDMEHLAVIITTYCRAVKDFISRSRALEWMTESRIDTPLPQMTDNAYLPQCRTKTICERADNDDDDVDDHLQMGRELTTCEWADHEPSVNRET